MRFLIELEITTVAPLVIEADSKEETLDALTSARAKELLSGDPIPQPTTVKPIIALGE